MPSFLSVFRTIAQHTTIMSLAAADLLVAEVVLDGTEDVDFDIDVRQQQLIGARRLVEAFDFVGVHHIRLQSAQLWLVGGCVSSFASILWRIYCVCSLIFRLRRCQVWQAATMFRFNVGENGWMNLGGTNAWIVARASSCSSFSSVAMREHVPSRVLVKMTMTCVLFILW
ncbi:hypothetical protein OG21DRAFT_942506 [Imleria badia]|nr:hypothetical protein OG21DRAFT_942506 [Imleria badia]